MSSSWLEPLFAYLRTRLPARLYLPCTAFLVLASLGGSPSAGAARLVWAGVLGWALLLQFRLLDDLCDLPHDRRAHPERVLVRAESLTPFRVLLGLSFAANLTLLLGRPGPARAWTFLALTAAAGAWYGIGRRIFPGRVLGYHVVLGKYPVFVLLLSGEVRDRWRLGLSMALVYLCFCIYEALHDEELAASASAARALAAEAVALFAVAELTALALLGSGGSAAVQGLLGLGAVPALVLARRGRPEATYVLFGLGFALVANLSMGE
ncbi:MAG: hypothetical protein HY900_22915 [Deltaproteobacteria bacterium]|nr:hypothetical protein [Deltaproteobacteria bacterium]